MKAARASHSERPASQSLFATSLGVSIILHGVVITWMLGGSGPSQAWLTDLPAFHSVSLVDAPASAPAPAPSMSAPEPQDIPEPAVASEAVNPATVEIVEPQVAVQPPQATRAAEVTAVSVETPAPADKPEPVVIPDVPDVIEAEARQPKPVEHSERQPAPTPASASLAPAATPSASAMPREPASRNSPQAADRARQAIANLRNAQAQGDGAGEGGGGLADGMQQVLMRTYQQRVRVRIINAWRLPMLPQAAEKLQAMVLLTVDRDGHVLRYELAEPSGNSPFDDSLQRAVQASSPLPPLPDTVTGVTQELMLRFTPPAS